MKIHSNKTEVITFIEDLNAILNKSDFDINKDFVLINNNKPEDIEHSTSYTMNDLEYNVEDVVEELKTLVLEDYSETLLDHDDPNPPLLFVFGKRINRKLIYVKVKNKDKQKKQVLCVSFHYAKEEMFFPYA